jgi:16S rRNA G527 N7-methylase RsmG
MTKLLDCMQHAGETISKRGNRNLVCEASTYNLSVENESRFVDIGSGFGKPTFHCAIQTGCPSLGVEVVPARVAVS